jgi:ClpP class serine protease
LQRRSAGVSLSDDQLLKIYEEAEKRALATHDGKPDMLSRLVGKPLLEDSRYTMMRDDAPGVAILSIVGPIYRRANLMTSMSGATSTGRLAQEFHQAMADTRVSRILIDHDSPGGEAHGIGEFADMIYDAAQEQKKDVVSYVGGVCCSADYYLAAASRRIAVSKSAWLGSIGTVIKAHKPSKDSEVVEFVSAQSPKKRPIVGTEEGDSEIQRMVNEMSQVFIDDAARYRGTTPEIVQEKFGQGGILMGRTTVDVGMADEVSSFEAVLKSLAAGTFVQGTSVGEGASQQGLALTQEEVADILSDTSEVADEDMTADQRRLRVLALRSEAAREEALEKEARTKQKAQEGQGDADMGLLDKWRTDKKGEVGGGSKEAQGTKPDAGQDNPFSPENIALRVAELTEKHGPEATLFAQNAVLQGHIWPVELDNVGQGLIEAMIDDALLPRQVSFVLEGVEKKGTRAERAKAEILSRPKHTLAEEAVAAVKDGDKAASVVADAKEDKDEKVVTSERKLELLGRSGQGRAALRQKETASASK